MSNKEIYIAATDLGTNSIHGIIAEMDSSGLMNIIHRDKETVRLGLCIENGIINNKGLTSSIKAISRIQKEAEKYSANVIAVATSAIREAKNKEYFINSVFKETGILIDVIDGMKEAELISKGVMSQFETDNLRTLIIDIGGGSTEIILYHNNQIRLIKSLKLGAIRTSLEFFENYISSNEKIEKCKRHIKAVLSDAVNKIYEIGYDRVVGTSGTVQALGKAVYASQNKPFAGLFNNIKISVNDLKSVFYAIENNYQPEMRALLPGIDRTRADIITAGELILQVFLKSIHAEEIKISSYALREGIIIDAFEKINNNNLING